jgi:hypothetical protein
MTNVKQIKTLWKKALDYSIFSCSNLRVPRETNQFIIIVDKSLGRDNG